MQFGHRTFTIADPRNFEGNPFEVAERAVGQLAGMAALMHEAMPPLSAMARNAELERQLQRGEDPDVEKWNESAQFKLLTRIRDQIAAVERDLQTLRRAASFDPKHPPKI